MKQGIRFLLCALALAGVLGCDKNDDGDGKDGSDKVQEKSVLGEAITVGVFPDGTVAQPLDDQQMAAIGKVTEGAMRLNRAVANTTPMALQRSADPKVEAVQGVLRSGLVQKLLGLQRARVTDTQQFEEDLRKCVVRSTETPHNEIGNDTEKHVSWSASHTIGGAVPCPLDSNMKLDIEMHARRIGENAAKVVGGLNFAYETSLRNEDDQLSFDFVNQGLNGRMDGEILVRDQSEEIAANGTLKGHLQTKTQGTVEAQLLFDLYMLQTQTQQGKKSDPNLRANFRLALAVILKTNAGNVLLQVFASGTEKETFFHAYLNGKELKQLENPDSSHSKETITNP